MLATDADICCDPLAPACAHASIIIIMWFHEGFQRACRLGHATVTHYSLASRKRSVTYQVRARHVQARYMLSSCVTSGHQAVIHLLLRPERCTCLRTPMDRGRGRRGDRRGGPGRGHVNGRGRGRGGGRQNHGEYGGRGSATNWSAQATNHTSASTTARGINGPIRACSLRFHADTPQDQVQKWLDTPEWNQKWISPEQGFRGASIYVFWDMENCRPGACPELKLTAEDFPVIFRDAFKKDSGATRLKVYGSLTHGYKGIPGEEDPLPLQYAALNSKLNTTPGWLVTTANGKKAAAYGAVHKDEAEADNQLHSQMQDTILNDCKAGDVIIIIGGDATYKTKVHLAHDSPVGYINVIAIGPQGGIANSMAIHADHVMIWEKLLRDWSRVLKGRHMPVPAVDVQLQQQVLRDHVQRFSVVKDLDLIILMDITGSMEPYLEAVRTKLGEVFDSIQARWANRGLVGAGCGCPLGMRKGVPHVGGAKPRKVHKHSWNTSDFGPLNHWQCARDALN